MSTTPVSAQPIFHISAIPASTIDKVRRGGPDASGRPAETVTCGGGEPLRGSDPAAAIAELLADPAVEQVHSRNVAYGYFMFSIRRAAVITTSE
jgi:Protein of unknown function (DUF1203)